MSNNGTSSTMDFTRKDEDIIFDFFDGSGTTAQLNQQDGINRKFILVQFPEAPRAARVTLPSPTSPRSAFAGSSRRFNHETHEQHE